ncbi:type ISP restriction/modification enzyme [uncultured Lawsonella sp.]|uniref:type ISP restriction/modification enzyme n=1 Tax=uncultured Lawsonella sp. TaxID=1847727 RepID=UPI0025F4919E|nr:type ISP restriction/modification enzyme [uncultured Lawsonella sp.]
MFPGGGNLNKGLIKGITHSFLSGALQQSIYRPFCKQTVYFDRSMNERVYQLPQIFPTPKQPNMDVNLPAGPSAQYFMPIMYDMPPALTPNGGNQFFPLSKWDRVENDSIFSLTDSTDGSDNCNGFTEFSDGFDFHKHIGKQIPVEIDGYRCRDNITDATLSTYRRHYKDESISKEDIFFYVYALLYHPDYRSRYEANLKKMLPHIPKVANFWSYAQVGRELASLHVNYETVEAWPTVALQWADNTPDDEWDKYHVQRPAWGKKKGSRGKDFSTLVYNDYLTFTGIPVEANDYEIGGRSPLGWVIDQYEVTTNNDSGIRNDPNDYCREIGDPAYIAKLIPSLVTVFMKTQELIASLLEFVIDEEQ